MKATIEFNLPDDNIEYEKCNDAPKLASALWDFEQAMRKLEKYDDNKPITPDYARAMLREIMGECGITFDKTYFS